MNCKNLKLRSKNYKKYFYCGIRKEEIQIDECKKCKDKSYKDLKIPQANKHDRTKATSISTNVKEIVWERDNKKCIFCGKYVPMFYANAHFIKRSQRRIRNTREYSNSLRLLP